ncbi:hypothetical protein [Butyrivibrio sp. AD3002]|uniref:hypothetical protein n=1 Tax=Butyrivibrio sp. AD3002 TaxID=1280670 RepID=UPI0003B5832F|nr:hypothetical protein [Butyrivibrio sp. AD3002]
MESFFITLLAMAVLFGPLFLAAAIISKKDPRNNWDEEELQYAVEEKELTPDLELEAEKQKRENLKSKIFLIMKLALFIVTLTAAIISQNIKAILAVIVGTIVATCVNYGILNALDEK